MPAASIIRALMMKAVSTSETSLNLYQATQSNNLEDSHLHTIFFFQIVTNSTKMKYRVCITNSG
jgi:hypothetical protein